MKEDHQYEGFGGGLVLRFHEGESALLALPRHHQPAIVLVSEIRGDRVKLKFGVPDEYNVVRAAWVRRRRFGIYEKIYNRELLTNSEIEELYTDFEVGRREYGSGPEQDLI